MKEEKSVQTPPGRSLQDQREALRKLCGHPFPSITGVGKKWLPTTIVSVEDNSLVLRFTVEARHCNDTGQLVQSLLLACLDEAAGSMLFAQGRRLVSLSFSADFHGTARMGDTLDIHTEIISEKGRHICIQSEIGSASGRVVTSTAHALVVSRRHSS